MSKNYHEAQADPIMKMGEPVFAYHVQDSQQASVKSDSLLANTMSVDEFFDELISQVHKDYASL